MTLDEQIKELEDNARKFYKDQDWLMLRQTWGAWHDLKSIYEHIHKHGWLDLRDGSKAGGPDETI